MALRFSAASTAGILRALADLAATVGLVFVARRGSCAPNVAGRQAPLMRFWPLQRSLVVPRCSAGATDRTSPLRRSVSTLGWTPLRVFADGHCWQPLYWPAQSSLADPGCIWPRRWSESFILRFVYARCSRLAAMPCTTWSSRAEVPDGFPSTRPRRRSWGFVSFAVLLRRVGVRSSPIQPTCRFRVAHLANGFRTKASAGEFSSFSGPADWGITRAAPGHSHGSAVPPDGIG